MEAFEVYFYAPRTTSVKIKTSIPQEASSFIHILPDDAVIQGQSRVTALARISCEEIPQDSEYFNKETGLFDVPIEIRLQNHAKLKENFALKFHVRSRIPVS